MIFENQRTGNACSQVESSPNLRMHFCFTSFVILLIHFVYELWEGDTIGGVTEERHTWDIFWCWFYFLTEVWSLDMGCNWKSPSWYHDWYCFGYTLYFSIWSSILVINTVCFVMLVFIYNFHFVSPILCLN